VLEERLMHDPWPAGYRAEHRIKELDGQVVNLRAENERLRRHVGRLRKAVTWLVGALHEETHGHYPADDGACSAWECQRARVVLDETSTKAVDA
jgi:hypothetical protein